MKTLKAGLSILVLVFALIGCGIHSADPIFTPTGGNVFVPNDGWEYAPSNKAAGNGWNDGYYSMGYGGAGQGGFCLGAACFCPSGWSSGEFTASMLVAHASASGALASSGKSTLDSENEIWVDSNNATCVTAGGNTNMIAPDYFLVGGYSGSLTGTVHPNQAPLSDPLQFLPYPNSAELTLRSSSLLSISTTTTLQPGIYDGGIAISSGALVTLAPGLFYIRNGGLMVGSHGNLAGTEITLFFADGNATSTLSIQGGASAQLTPPTDGYTQGITLFFHRSNTSNLVITGGGNLQIFGSIYAKSANVTLGGNGNMVAGSQIVASKVSVGGNGSSKVTTAGGIYALPTGCFAP